MDADAKAVVATIESLQAAVAQDDQARLADLICPDFHAFENGAAMTGAEVIGTMRKYHAEGRRYRWSVQAPQVEVAGPLAVVVYTNHGSITAAPGGEPAPQSWLETVLLRREGSRWRVAFLHSTRARSA